MHHQTHDSGCSTEERKLTCTESDLPGHKHTENCYVWERGELGVGSLRGLLIGAIQHAGLSVAVVGVGMALSLIDLVADQDLLHLTGCRGAAAVLRE